MKGSAIVRTSLIAVMALMLVGLSSGMLGATDAAASLGDSSVPVRCYTTSILAPGKQAFLYCVASDGTLFPESQRVPTGYYLLVTDVLITPDAGTAMTGLTDITVFDAYSTSSRQSSFRLRNSQANSFGFNFNAPYFSMPAGHRLEVTSASLSAFGAEIRISGFLVTDVDSLPLAPSE